ncbi:MAG TPA: hypothetical protein VKK81_14300 [Candidatus Binatia bacterium]|nr:hypothetical protein [Candidatus Binatia bacterium]
MHTKRGTVCVEQFVGASPEKENFWSAQAMLALFLPKAMLWATDGRSMASPAQSGSTAPALQGQVPSTRLPAVLASTLVMACSLALLGFASPAAAKTIVVTTLTDTADPRFNADGACGTGTISNLPGADGLTSLREAIIATNNTSGANIITFAQNLSGGTIVVGFNGRPLPANVLEGQIFQNTATTVTVADGTPGNTATVTQFNNDLCP